MNIQNSQIFMILLMALFTSVLAWWIRDELYKFSYDFEKYGES